MCTLARACYRDGVVQRGGADHPALSRKEDARSEEGASGTGGHGPHDGDDGSRDRISVRRQREFGLLGLRASQTTPKIPQMGDTLPLLPGVPCAWGGPLPFSDHCASVTNMASNCSATASYEYSGFYPGANIGLGVVWLVLGLRTPVATRRLL
jgi:hypothetical protein